MNAIKSFFRHIDLYGVKVDIHVENQRKYTTVLGGLFSLIQIIVALFLFIALGSDMMHRTNPIVVLSEIYNQMPTKTIFSKYNYFFMLGMQLPGSFNQFYDPSIYNISLYIDIDDNINPNNSARIAIPVEHCTDDHVPPDLLENFRSMAGGNFYDMACVAKDLDGKLSIEGAYDAPLFTRFQLYITPCVNSSDAQICKPQADIDAALSSGYFSLYSTDNIVDLREFENPGKKITRDYYVPTAYGLTKIITRWITTAHVSSDDGWIVNDERNLDYEMFYSDSESFNLYVQNKNQTKILVDYVIRKTNYEKIYQRSYKKVQNVFAEMGGFLNICFLFFYVLAMPYVTSSYFDMMANKLYNFQIDDSKKLEKASQNNTKKLETMKSIFNEIKSENNGICKQHLPRKDYFQEQAFQPKESPIQISLWEKIKNLLTRNRKINEKMQQRKTGVQAFLEKIDITFILNKFLEIEKLKILLLNEDQYHLFAFFPKPFITKRGKILLNCVNPFDKEPSSPKRKSEIVSNMETFHKAKTVRDAYNRINNKKDPNQIDEKLLELIDDDIKNLLVSNDDVPLPLHNEFEAKRIQDGKDGIDSKRDALIEVDFKSVVSEGNDNLQTRMEKYTKKESV